MIDGLKGGSPVLSIDRGHQVARLEPVTTSPGAEHDGKLMRLVRDGIVRPRRAAPPRALFSDQPPRAEPGASALNALLEERWEGR